MKLTGKIILIYMFAMTLLIVLFGYSIVLREDERLRREMEEQAERIAVAFGNGRSGEILCDFERRDA